jgi:predicted DNA-binding transcriptional regulator AlpA
MREAIMGETALIRASTVRELLGVSTVTLWRWRKENTGPRWCTLGTRVMYDAEDVTRFVAERFTLTRGTTAGTLASPNPVHGGDE